LAESLLGDEKIVERLFEGLGDALGLEVNLGNREGDVLMLLKAGSRFDVLKDNCGGRGQSCVLCGMRKSGIVIASSVCIRYVSALGAKLTLRFITLLSISPL
jgi:hypothetical protein